MQITFGSCLNLVLASHQFNLCLDCFVFVFSESSEQKKTVKMSKWINVKYCMHSCIIILTENIFFVVIAGTSLDFHKQKDYHFLVATEAGKIHKVIYIPYIYIFCINKCPVNILLSEDIQSWVISLSHFSSLFESGSGIVACFVCGGYLLLGRHCLYNIPLLSLIREEVFLVAVCLCTAITAERAASANNIPSLSLSLFMFFTLPARGRLAFKLFILKNQT